MVKALAAISLALSPFAAAVPFRLASFNVGALYLTANPEFGIGAPGTQDYEKVREVLARIKADVVALEEVHNVDIDDETPDTPEALASLAASLGYDHIYIPPRTTLDFTLRVVILSKYPFISSDSIGSPGTAKDVTRRLPAVRVNIPNTDRDPLIIAGHLKSSTGTADRFRRAVELKRVADYLAANNITAADNFIITGDFNLSSINTTFTAAPTGLPSAPNFVLGSDITYPFTYSTDAAFYFTSPSVARLDLRQVNGSATTFPISSSAIDVMLVSPAIANRPVFSEVYNSALDTADGIGLTKYGALPASDTSALASDHLAIFADIELDVGFPKIDLALSVPTVPENAAAGLSKLTVSLPAALSSAITINLASDNPSVARLATTTLSFPAGTTSATVDVITSRNFLASGNTSVTFTASATNHESSGTILQVLDSDVPYRFTAAGQTITENFNGFDGTHDPAPWVTSPSILWNGIDSGSSPTPGFRSYGTTADSSLGYLPDSSIATPTTFSATYSNQSSTILQSLEISLTAEQWRAASGGTADQLKAEIISSAGTFPVPSLSFSPAVYLPSGPVSPAQETPLTATVSGLSIPPGQSFDLRFTLTPGTGGGALPADIFINEFHYDNTGDDVNEFVEIIVGPGFTGNLADVKLYLYNGETAGVTYGAVHPLSSFAAGSVTSSGYRIFYKMIPDLQNGPRDGFALVNGAQVLQFISYEGAFAATNGPAISLTAIDTGVSQTTTAAANTNSIRLIGNGSKSTDFAWTKSAIAHSPGALNEGQTLTAPSQSQGIAIDNVSVKFLVPPDLDSDGDGFTDLVETNLLLTDPLNANSRFTTTITRPVSTGIHLEFPTLTGRKYLIQTSNNLTSWDDGPEYSGTGTLRAIDFLYLPAEPKYFYRVVVSFE